MHVADSSMQIALPLPRLTGQTVLIALIAGVTWLALVGGVLSSYILSSSSASHHLPIAYAAFDRSQAVPTGYGSFTVSRADLIGSADSVQVDLTLSVTNTQDSQVDAPRLEDFRVVTTAGAEAARLPNRWSGPSVLIPQSTSAVTFGFQAPPDAGLLWLEYRDPQSAWPTRVVLGAAQLPASED